MELWTRVVGHGRIYMSIAVCRTNAGWLVCGLWSEVLFQEKIARARESSFETKEAAEGRDRGKTSLFGGLLCVPVVSQRQLS